MFFKLDSVAAPDAVINLGTPRAEGGRLDLGHSFMSIAQINQDSFCYGIVYGDGALLKLYLNKS